MNAIRYVTPFVYEKGKVALEAVGKHFFKKHLFTLIGSYMGGPTAVAVQIVFPFVSGKAQEVALQVLQGSRAPSMVDCVQDLCTKQEKFFKSFVVLINSSPQELVILHAGHFLKKGSLKCICDFLSQIAGTTVGDTLYIAAAPTVLPSVSPLTSSRGQTLVHLGMAAAQRGISWYSADEKPKVEEIELEDFDDFVIVDGDEIPKDDKM